MLSNTLFVFQKMNQDPALLGAIKYMRQGGADLLEIKKKYRRFQKGEKVDIELMKKIIKLRPKIIIFWLLRVNCEEIKLLKSFGFKISVVINGFASFSTGLSTDQEAGMRALKLLDAYFIPQKSHVKQLQMLGIKAYHLPLWASNNFKPSRFYLPFKIWDFIFVGNFGENDPQGQHRRSIIKVFENAGRVLIISDKRVSKKAWWIPSLFGYEWIIRICSNLSYAGIASDFFPGINGYNKSYHHLDEPYKLESEYCIRPRSYCYYHQGIPFFVEKSEDSLREFSDIETVYHWSNFKELDEKIDSFLNSKERIAKIARAEALENTKKFMISERFSTILNWMNS